MTVEEKKKIFGGSSNSWWNGSIGFGVVGSTIIGLFQTIASIVSYFTNKNETNKKSDYNPSYSKNLPKFRISKYPTNSTAFI